VTRKPHTPALPPPPPDSWWLNINPATFYALARDKFPGSDSQPVRITAQGQSQASVKAERGKR
jgi:hypothetical protein